ncbi:MAG: hypothetical protein H0W06_10520 [Chloroflexia bacterium]|nr:hypothetical protein [Chloroflexia bacterium]
MRRTTTSEHQSGSDDLKQDVLKNLDVLDSHDQRRVLDFTRALAVRRRSTGKGGAILALAGAFSPDDLAEMKRAIEEDCERVDEAQW